MNAIPRTGTKLLNCMSKVSKTSCNWAQDKVVQQQNSQSYVNRAQPFASKVVANSIVLLTK